MSYQQNSSRLRRLPDFYGITDSSGLIPLSQIRDNGMINNGIAPQLVVTPSMLWQLIVKAEACKDTAHYCDTVGFTEVPQFLNPQQTQEKENPLRTAEMTIEDDYGMIDGVNPEESVIPKKSCKRRRRDEFCL